MNAFGNAVKIFEGFHTEEYFFRKVIVIYIFACTYIIMSESFGHGIVNIGVGRGTAYDNILIVCGLMFDNFLTVFDELL